MVNPKLRFKRQDGTAYPDWEEKPLSAVFEEVSEKGYTDLPVLSIVQGKGTIVRDDSDRRISYDKTNVKSYKRVLFGDYIIHLRSFEGGLEMSNHDGIVSPAYHVLRNNGSTINKPLYRPYFRSFDFITNRLAPSVVGIRDGKSIDMDTFWETTIPYPSVDEQRRMADFFVAVDKKIEAQEQYVAALETQKKELLRQVFAREIRFKDENGQDFPEWDRFRLGDLAMISVGSKPDAIIDSITDVQYINAGTSNSGYTEASNRSGDIVTTPSRGQGGIGYVAYHSEPIWLGPLCYGIKSSSAMIITRFIYCILSAFPNWITELKKTGSIPAVNQEDLSGIYVPVPSLPEQQRIADFFTALDAQIENERALLEDWRQLKKGLLQQMFV